MDFPMSVVLLWVLALILLGVLQFVWKGSHRSTLAKLPPGPSPLPLVGNLLDLGDKPHKSLAKLAQIHGPLITLKLGQVATIVVSSSTIAKQVFQTHDLALSDRLVIDAVQAHDHHEGSLVWLPVDGPWRNLRKICNSHIFSIQKLDANQQLRLKKIRELLADVQESCRAGGVVDIGEAAFKTTLNALSSTVFSLDLSDSSSNLVREFKEVVRCVMDEAGKPNLADYFPFLRKIDPQRIRTRMGIYFGRILDLFDQIICERMESRRSDGYIPVNDMLDTLLTISEDNQEEMDTSGIKHLLLDLFVAGTDTTSSTLEWAMAELLRKPTVLAKARAELGQIIGRGNLIEESDIPRLPYMQAIIKETLRLHPPVPLLIPRKAGADVEISGFTIPKDAQLLVNVWNIGRDQAVWTDPLSFIPERFLGSDVDVRGKYFELIPFGAGRRVCPGLPLAMRMLHLMLGSLILSFDWKLANGVTSQSMDMEEKFGITLQKAQTLLVVPVQL